MASLRGVGQLATCGLVVALTVADLDMGGHPAPARERRVTFDSTPIHDTPLAGIAIGNGDSVGDPVRGTGGTPV